MRKIRNFLVCLLLCIGTLCFYAGCNWTNIDSNDGITGIEDGYIYIIELGDIAAEFETGSATISKDGGEATEYLSGTLITEDGEYVIVWSNGSTEKTYTFTVKHKTPDAPVVSGVVDGQKIEYGNSVAPTFDKGSATLSKDGAIAEPYEQGTEISEIGSYLLTVTYEGVSTSINFEITLPNYAGQMTDEFIGGILNREFLCSDGILSIEGEALRIVDKQDEQGWAIIRREFKGLDLNAYPYVEFNVVALQNAAGKFSVGVEEFIGAQEAFISTYAYAPGKVYLDLKSYASEMELDLSNANLWLQIAIEGQKLADGELTMLLESIKSITEMPQEVAVGQYIDNTAETLNAWVANTAKLSYFEGSTCAMGTVIDPDNVYGKFVKRVQFNTVKYPYLTVDVQDVVSAWKIEALTYENNYFVGDKVLLFKESSAVGVSEVNLQNIFGLDECVDVVLEFYIVGKSDEKFFSLNGLNTSSDPYYAPVVSGIGEGAIHNVSANGALKVSFDKGTATLAKNGGEAVEYVKGTEITEVGEYTLTVTAGSENVKTTTVSFMVINQDYEEGVIEDYLNKSKFSVIDGTYEVVKESDKYVAKMTKPENKNMTMLVSRMDIDFTQNSVLKWVFETEGFNYDPGFSMEILDDVNWFKVLIKNTNANFVESKKLENGRTQYTVYYKVGEAVHTGNALDPVLWAGTTKTNLKITVMLEFGAEKSVYLTSLALIETYPDEGIEYPVITGIEDGATHNIATDGQLIVSFDSGNATISKDGAEGVTFASGSEITEVGSYVLTVKAGISKITKIGFTVINQAAEPEKIIGSVVDNYSTVDGFTVTSGNGSATYDADNDELVLTKNESAPFVQLAKTGNNLDFKANGNYLVLVFETEGYIPDAGFYIEILDDTYWYHILRSYSVAGDKAPFDYIEKENLNNGRVRHTCYIKVTDAKKVGGDAVTNWASIVKNGLKITVTIEYGGEKTVYLKYLSVTNTMPEGVNESIVDDYTDPNFIIDKPNSTAVYDSAKDEIILTKAVDEDVKFTKQYTFDFAQHGNYLVLQFETQGYTPDTGFLIEILDDVSWYSIKFRNTDESGFNRFTKTVTSDLGNGRTLYTLYMEINEAQHATNGSKTWADTVVTAKFSISIWWGGEKAIYLKSLELVKELPNSSIVDDYTDDNFVVDKPNSTAVYDSAKDEIILTKAVDEDVKFTKQYTFDFAQHGNYLVLQFETQGYTPDTGFLIEILDDVSWYSIKFRNTDESGFNRFAKIVTSDLGNGRTLYTLYMEINEAQHATNGSKTWADTVVTAKFSISIWWGGEKQIFLKSLELAKSIPGGSMVDDYTDDNFVVDKPNSTAVYDSVNDEIVLTKAVDEDVKFTKQYTFDFAKYGNYLVLQFETQGYTPDTGFLIEILDDISWYSIKFRNTDESGFNRFAKIVTSDLGNGRTLYTLYMEINEAQHATNGSKTWADTVVTAKFSISIWWGGEKQIFLKSLYLTDSLPSDGN